MKCNVCCVCDNMCTHVYLCVIERERESDMCIGKGDDMSSPLFGHHGSSTMPLSTSTRHETQDECKICVMCFPSKQAVVGKGQEPN